MLLLGVKRRRERETPGGGKSRRATKDKQKRAFDIFISMEGRLSVGYEAETVCFMVFLDGGATGSREVKAFLFGIIYGMQYSNK